MTSNIPNRGPQLLAIDIAFMTAAVIANALRCFVRISMVKAFGLDDWLMAIATVSFVAYCSFSIAGVHYGTGRHHADLPLQGIQHAVNRWWYCYLFYSTSMITSKLSIGWFLLRIAVKKVHAWIIYGAMFISVIAGTVFFFVTLLQCKPISYFWNKEQPGHCVNIDVIVGLAFLYSVFSIISDFTFAIIPAFLVWNLQLKRRTKVALIPLLTMGCIASSAVVVRLPFLPRLRRPDFLWETLDIAIWSTVEQGLGITAGSLATLRPLFQIATHKLGLSTGPSKNRPSNYGRASRSASGMLGSGRKPSQDMLNRYNLSNLTEVGATKEIVTETADSDLRSPSPTWYHPAFSKPRRSMSKKRVPADNESEKNLQARDSNESSEQNGMQIMVSKSFVVTDEEK